MPFSTPFTFCSIGVATDASTSVAEAPTKVVVTWTIGGTTSGYWAVGRPDIATSPTRTVTMEITIATIGRLTEKRAMLLHLGGRLRALGGGGGRRGLRAHDHAVPHLLQALDHDLLARLQALLDQPEAVHPRPHLDVAERHLVAFADHRDAVEVLQLDHGSLRDEESALLRLGDA